MLNYCVLTAGGVPSVDDPLYSLAQGAPKAMLELAGKPMTQWVLDALTETPEIRHVLVVGLTPEHGLHSSKITAYLPDAGSLYGNVWAAADWLTQHAPHEEKILGCCADLPLLRSEMFQWLIEEGQAQAAEFAYTVVPRATMEARFPGAGRSYVPFAGEPVAGGDVHLIDPGVFDRHRELWTTLIQGRKNVVGLLRRLGPGLFIRLLLRRLTLDQLTAHVHARLGLHVRALPTPYAEMGMDVDKPAQAEICRRELAQRGGAGS